tara:strand:- start:25 stop:339 length:315 start_codon:yes stop_codon:yes gene_type:complete
MANVAIYFKGYNSITQGYNEGGYESDVAFIGLTSALGSVASVGDTVVSVTGVSAGATAGNTSESAGGGISIGVTGFGLTGLLGTINIWSDVQSDQTPNWTEIAA